MAAAAKEQLNSFVNSMFTEGLLDDQFCQLQMLQDANNPGFIAEVLALFCEDAQRLLKELATLLDQVTVDYRKLDAYVHQLKGSSSSVGAQQIRFACIRFRQFCEENNKEGCVFALNQIKQEFFRMKTKFETMIQLEQKILACEGKQR